jgi:hypothetical protein
MAYRVWRLDVQWHRNLRVLLGAFLVARDCLFFGSCAWETFGSAGLPLVRFANPRTAATLLFGDN